MCYYINMSDDIKKVLTDNPQITFFSTIHRRHTEFQTYNRLIYDNTNNFSDTIKINILRCYNLLSKINILIKLPKKDVNNKPINYVDDIKNAIMKQIEFSIGGIIHEEINNDILNIQSCYFSNTSVDGDNTYLVQLPFFNVSTQKFFLPLCALSKHECNLVIKLENKNNCIKNM
jgi:hypothetical protein